VGLEGIFFFHAVKKRGRGRVISTMLGNSGGIVHEFSNLSL